MGATNLERTIIEKGFLFGLAKKTPIFIVDKKLYYCTNHDASPDFFIKDNNSKELRVMEGPSLEAVERISAKIIEKDCQKFQEEFVAEELTRLNNTGAYDPKATSGYKKLVMFTLKEIFPYLRKDNSKELEDVLEITSEEAKPIEEDKTPDKKYERKIEDYVAKRILELEAIQNRMQIQRPPKKISEERLDRLFFRTNPADFHEDKENTDNSLFTRLIGCPNFAVDKNYFYSLERTSLDAENLNIKGAKYRLSAPYPILELQRNFSAEIIKGLSIEALRNKLKDSKEFEELKKQRNDLENLSSRKEYHEKDFGFKRYSDQDNVLFVYVDVPEHVLEDPGYKQLYRFDRHELGVTITLDNNNNPVLNAGPFCSGYADGPFYGSVGGLCMGNYSRGYFGSMPFGKAVAKLLIDARNVVLHGYTARVGPHHKLETYGSRIISPSEVEKRNLPITNINQNAISDVNPNVGYSYY
jgi:hypothetical protein